MVNVVSKSEQVTALLRKEIAGGRFAAGDKIPIEPELSRIYKVGRGTIREAISSLVHEGMLSKEQGRGTFVTMRRAFPPMGAKLAKAGLSYGFSPQYQPLIKQLQDYVLDRGGMLTVYNVERDRQDSTKERQFLEFAAKDDFLGVALYPTPVAPVNTELYRELRRGGMKVALLVPYVEGGDDHVTFFHDYERSGYLAAAKMAAGGCEAVCVACLDTPLPLAFRMMKDGLVKGAADFGMAALDDLVVDQTDLYGDIRTAGPTKVFPVWERLPRKTGILATQNQACLSVKRLSALSRRRIPEDLALCVCAAYEHHELGDVSLLLLQAEPLLTAAINYILDGSVGPEEPLRRTFNPVFHDRGSI